MVRHSPLEKATNPLPQPKPAPLFEVVPDGWNVLPLQRFTGEMGGIFAIEDEDEAKKLAEAAAHKSFPVGVLSPVPIDIGIGEPRQLLVEFYKCVHGQRQVVTLQAYLHQLTAHEVVHSRNARTVDIARPQVQRTQVVYVKYTDQSASTQTKVDLKSLKAFVAKSWLQTLLQDKVTILDIWHIQHIGVQDGSQQYSASIRVPNDQTELALQVSMPSRIQTNVPNTARGHLSHVWLKDSSGPLGESQVKELLASCPVPHLVVSK